MRECFVDVAVRRTEGGQSVTVTKTCAEYIRELENKLARALDTLRSHNLSSTDSDISPAASILPTSEQCGRFFLVDVLTWTNSGQVIHKDETVKCVREIGHEDEIGCLDIHGWREKK